MTDKEFGGRRDRSYLCLVAIYAIHALLLNVFLQPQPDAASGATLGPSYVRGSTLRFVGRNGSETTASNGEQRRIVVAASIVNATTSAASGDGRTFVEDDDDDDDDNNGEYVAGDGESSMLHQSRSSGAAIRFLAISKASGVTRMASNAFDTARRVVKSLSPAALGILSGCLVFLLTFTENDYV